MTFFDDAYEGTPPWDIGKPQSAFVRLFEQGLLHQSPALDVGCGTGEHALFLAANGLTVTGVDAAPRAIAKAKEKAKTRGIEATFLVHDALDLAALGKTFLTVIDSGLFHVFGDRERVRFRNQLYEVMRPRGTYAMLCFSEKEPADWDGPRRVSPSEISETFDSPKFRVRSIAETRFDTNFHDDGGLAYLSLIERMGAKS